MPETSINGSGLLFQFTGCLLNNCMFLLEWVPIILVDLHGGEREKDGGGEEGRKRREGGMERRRNGERRFKLRSLLC